MFGANLTKLTAVFPEPRTEPRSVFFSSLSSGTSEHICGTSANSQRVHLEFRCINFLVLAKLVFRCNQTESSHHFLLKFAFLEANLRGCTLTLRFQWDFSIFLLTADGESCSSTSPKARDKRHCHTIAIEAWRYSMKNDEKHHWLKTPLLQWQQKHIFRGSDFCQHDSNVIAIACSVAYVWIYFNII